MNPQRTPNTDTGPLVSCVIVFLNAEPYLREAIESVLAQSYRNWELLLIDDGSTDNSRGIAHEYSATDPARIRYFMHESGMNCGISASRNLALSKASGTYLAFLDGDDVWLPRKIDRQLELFRENPEADIVCGAMLSWYSWHTDSEESDRIIRFGESVRASPPVCLPQDMLHSGRELMPRMYPLGSGSTTGLSGMMISLSLARSVGGFEDQFRGLFEDQVFWAKAYLNSCFYVSSEHFHRYRRHPESCVQQSRGTRLAKQSRRLFLEWLRTYLNAAGERDSVIRSKLRRLLFKSRHPRLYRTLSKLRQRFTRLMRHQSQAI